MQCFWSSVFCVLSIFVNGIDATSSDKETPKVEINRNDFSCIHYLEKVERLLTRKYDVSIWLPDLETNVIAAIDSVIKNP